MKNCYKDVVVKIINEYRIEIIKQPRRFYSILQDLSPNTTFENNIIYRTLVGNEELCNDLYNYFVVNDPNNIGLKKIRIKMKEIYGISDEWINWINKELINTILEIMATKTIEDESKITNMWEQYQLGYNNEFGLGCPVNYEKARYWYLLAAKQNCSWAQNRLGDLYSNGKGVSQDYCEAFKWYELGSNNGDDTATYSMGMCYFNGRGTNQDYKKAFFCFINANKLAYRNDKPGNIGVLTSYMIAYCYQYGLGAEKYLDYALVWYKKSAEEGYRPANEKIREIKSQLNN